MAIRNPVLRGFHPDPSVLCVGEEIWIATSTFEWCPGIRLHRSRDLETWTLAGHVLARPTQIPFAGVPDSGGVWAPHLSWDGRRFYVVYPLVRARGAFPSIAVENHLVHADRLEGPWSEPKFLNGSGWDPCLFHGRDGRSYLLNMELDVRAGERATRGIVLQEIVLPEGTLVGEPRPVFGGTALGCTEGPELFVRDGFHYLVTAEGGTSFEHAATVARSRTLAGPYEVDPAGPLLTTRDDPAQPLQKAGHASLFSWRGDWYLAHLAARTVSSPARDCPLGRETAIARVNWTADGWPRLAGGGHHPALTVDRHDAGDQGAERSREAPRRFRDEFDGPRLELGWSTPREPADESWLRCADGRLHLRGRAPLFSTFHQSFVARRIETLRGRAAVRVDFPARSIHETAGLACYRDTIDHACVYAGYDEALGPVVTASCMDRGRPRAIAPRVPVGGRGRLSLCVTWEPLSYGFGVSFDDGPWETLGERLPFTHLGDEHGGKDSFTGAVVGPFAVDAARQSRWAAFDWFDCEGEEQ